MRAATTAGLIGLSFVLASCAGSSPGSSPSEDSSPSMIPSATVATAEPVPTDALADFSCDLPVVESGTVALANITDVRVGAHPEYDRVVFEFADGLPETTLDRATPPFSHDASGAPIEVAGSSFLRLTLRGGTKQTADHTSSYDGPTEFRPGLPSLVHLIEGGDFEAQSTWYLGMTSEACVRVLRLTDDGPPRLVIDIQH
ncbi:MAG: AMIN-like domain-containing (lipo)protein [Candidatus Limnocylindria bacterium]